MAQNADIDVIAGAVASAIRQSLNTSVSRGSAHNQVDAALSQNECSSSQVASTSLQPPTTYVRASDLSTPSAQKRPKFTPPSLFENIRNRRGRRGGRGPPKTTCYVRDVVLLPTDFKNRYGEVVIPRRKKRSLLSTAGLVGKLEINSGM